MRGFMRFAMAAGAAMLNIMDFRPTDLKKPEEHRRLQNRPTGNYRGGKSSHGKEPQRRGSNLRLHLGPSDAGRLMRNRTPQPGPVRLSCHDWFRRKHFGSSKRIRNMSDAERTRAHGILEEVRLGKKV